MQQTEHLKLKLIEGGDPVDWEVMNENAEKLEAEAARLDGALTQGLAAVAESIGSGGKNARIAWGSYTGNGKAGSANPVRLNFDFTPVVVAVVEKESYSYAAAHLIKGQTRGVFSGSTCLLTWSGNSVSWYNEDGNANYQMNTANIPYCYMAIGY